MSTPRPYRPIDCGAHDRLLALATRGVPCDLDVDSGEGSVSRVHGVIVDVYSEAGAEYLRFADGRRFRLDDLVAIDGSAMSRGEQDANLPTFGVGAQDEAGNGKVPNLHHRPRRY